LNWEYVDSECKSDIYCVGVTLKITQFLNHMYCLLINCILLRIICMSVDSSVVTVRKAGLDCRRKLVQF